MAKRYRIRVYPHVMEHCIVKAYAIQMRIFGFIWITIKEFYDEYGYLSGERISQRSAKAEAEKLLEMLEEYSWC